MAAGGMRPSYVAIWVWLVALLTVSLFANYLPGGRRVALLVIFGMALVKALLVAGNYMHLRWEPKFVTLALVGALACIAIFFLLLLPDMVLRDGWNRP